MTGTGVAGDSRRLFRGGGRAAAVAAAATLVLLAAGAAAAEAEPARCEATRDCPPPLACDVAGRCVRERCDEDGVGCRSRRDLCLRFRCYGPGDPDAISLAVAAYVEEEKSTALAVMLSLLVPGTGSFYAEDWWGILPLAGWAGGLGFWVQLSFSHMALPLSMVVLGLLTGVLWAVASVDDYNDLLWDRTVRAAEAEWAACRGARLSLEAGSLTIEW